MAKVDKATGKPPINSTPDPSEAASADKERDAMGFEIADDSRIAHLDFLAAVILIVVSVAVAITSIAYWQKQRVVFYESAGFMPIIISFGLFVMALRLLKESLKQDHVKSFIQRLKASAVLTVKSSQVHRALVGLFAFAIYVFIMLGRMEFWLASFITLAAVLVFVRYDGRWQTILKMLLIAALCVAGIVGLFQYAFSVPMP